MNYDKEPELPDTPLPTRNYRLIAVVAVVVLAVAGFFVYRQIAPPAANAPAAQTAEEKKLQAKITVLESRLQSIAEELAKLGDPPPVEAARALITEAEARQGELMRLRPNVVDEDALRLNEWQTKFGDLNAREWSQQSRDLEAASDDLLHRNDIPAAVEKLKAALQLQRDVNGSLASQGLKNTARQARLEQDTQRLEAEPLQAEIARLLAQARETVTAGQWAAALVLYGQARDAQQRLNRDYAGTRFTNELAVDRIEAEMATLGATEAHEQLEALVRQSDAAAAAKQLDRADELLAVAAAKQRLINEQFAKSRFVSMERLGEIETQRQTLHVRATVEEVRELDRQAAAHLRRRELFQAQELLTPALGKLEAALAQFPKARGIDEELRQRLGYLNLRQADLVQIQDQTYDLLLPLPGHEKFALLKTEVPQTLFQQVMNTNPSRNAGRTLPVDSVTYAEAEEFCRRLGWAIGATVRLPTAPEFRAAVGDPLAASANAWGAENSSGKSQTAGQKPGNALGFHDLLGNVAEWLAADAGDMGMLAGGSYAESRAQLRAIPLRPAPKTERARTNGFRVVVEQDLAAPR